MTWSHIGNGFFPDTATGVTDLGSALPTFSIEFKQGTPLGLQPGLASGGAAAPLTASGRVVSAVPEPASCLLAAGCLLLAAASRRNWLA